MPTDAEVLERLEEPYRAWLNRQANEGLPLGRLVGQFESQQYELQKSGILLRKGVTEKLPGELEHLVGNADMFDIVLLRPSTLHYHGNTSEVAKVLGGAGRFGSPCIFQAEQMPYGKALLHRRVTYGSPVSYHTLEQGMFVNIPTSILFGWKPNPKSHLELRVHLRKGANEVIDKKFDEW